MSEFIREEDIRTAAVIGNEACRRLKEKSVAVFGVGGVGGNVCEALARAGIGRIDLFDGDTVNASNINRQLIALHSTVGRPKVDVMCERILDINPHCDVRAYFVFYSPESSGKYPFSDYDYIVDAIDSVPAKVELASKASEAGIPIISAMGAGNKLEPTKFCVSDIYETQTCPLAKVMRKELRAKNLKNIKAVWSNETAVKTENGVVGSVPFVPGVVGYIIAGEVIKDLIK